METLELKNLSLDDLRDGIVIGEEIEAININAGIKCDGFPPFDPCNPFRCEDGPPCDQNCSGEDR